MLKKNCFMFLMLGTLSCATHTSPFSTKEENAWFIFQDEDFGSSYPVYCMANKKEATAEPACFKSKIVGFEKLENKYRPKKPEEN
jgi:hypothetical protein